MSSSSTAVASVGVNATMGPPIPHHPLPHRLSWIHGPSTTTSWFEHGKAGTAHIFPSLVMFPSDATRQ